jgi:NitT/TauT family transport system permease protein
MIRSLLRPGSRSEAIVLGAAGPLLLLLAWESAARVHLIDPFTLASPGRIGAAVADELASGRVFRHLLVSAGELAAGLALAAIVGVSLGFCMGLYDDVRYAFEPFVWCLYVCPLIVVYPVVVAWVGLGAHAVVALVFLLTVSPLAINALAGVRSVDPAPVRALRAFGGRDRDVVIRIVLPAALPLLTAGVRIAVARGLAGVVVGEIFSSDVGLGFSLADYGAHLRSANSLAIAVFITAFGWISTYLVSVGEARLGRWREH